MGFLSLERDELEARSDIYRECGLNVSAAARLAGVARQTMQHSLKLACEAGLISEEEMHPPNVPTRDEYIGARTRKIAAHQNKKRKGDWRKPVVAKLPARPFRLKIFGDPHLDSDGCNYELFERHWLDMDAAGGVYGVCVGDWFNNWLRALGHLWKKETVAPSDAWLCLEYLMEERGDALIAACSGNHDDWTHGPADPVDLLMKKYGVIYREGAVRPLLMFDGLPPIIMAIRHKWRGKSMYSAGHWGVSYANVNWRDHIMIGGHIHQDDPRLVQRADGTWCHVCQVSTFKEFDEFPDIHGFTGTKISPVWDLVIDPRKADSDPDKVKIFWTPEDAAGYLEFLRR